MTQQNEAQELTILVVALMGKVAGIDATTGAELWRNELPGGGYSPVDIHVAERRVLALAGGRLFCLERATGETRWSIDVGGSGRGTMLVEGKRIFVSSAGGLTCVNTRGEQQWTSSLPGLGMGSAALGAPGNVRQADEAGGS